MNINQTIPVFIPVNDEPNAYLSRLQEHIIPEILSTKGELNWGRLICTWREKQESGEIITHTYAACIDGKEGDIYLDCRPRKIFAKCLAHLFMRPFFTLIKTAYHISLYPLFKELTKAYHSTQPKEEKIKNIFKALTDIVLTPLYGLALTVATLGVLFFGIIDTEHLYEGRKILGKIEQLSNRDQAHTSWTLAECFQPYPLEILEYYGQKNFSHDTLYQELDPIDRQLANLARAHIRHKKRVFDLFSCSKLKPHTLYQSPILEF